MPGSSVPPLLNSQFLSPRKPLRRKRQASIASHGHGSLISNRSKERYPKSEQRGSRLPSLVPAYRSSSRSSVLSEGSKAGRWRNSCVVAHSASLQLPTNDRQARNREKHREKMGREIAAKLEVCSSAASPANTRAPSPQNLSHVHHRATAEPQDNQCHFKLRTPSKPARVIETIVIEDDVSSSDVDGEDISTRNAASQFPAAKDNVEIARNNGYGDNATVAKDHGVGSREQEGNSWARQSNERRDEQAIERKRSLSTSGTLTDPQVPPVKIAKTTRSAAAETTAQIANTAETTESARSAKCVMSVGTPRSVDSAETPEISRGHTSRMAGFENPPTKATSPKETSHLAELHQRLQRPRLGGTLNLNDVLAQSSKATIPHTHAVCVSDTQSPIKTKRQGGERLSLQDEYGLHKKHQAEKVPQEVQRALLAECSPASPFPRTIGVDWIPPNLHETKSLELPLQQAEVATESKKPNTSLPKKGKTTVLEKMKLRGKVETARRPSNLEYTRPNLHDKPGSHLLPEKTIMNTDEPLFVQPNEFREEIATSEHVLREQELDELNPQEGDLFDEDSTYESMSLVTEDGTTVEKQDPSTASTLLTYEAIEPPSSQTLMREQPAPVETVPVLMEALKTINVMTDKSRELLQSEALRGSVSAPVLRGPAPPNTSRAPVSSVATHQAPGLIPPLRSPQLGRVPAAAASKLHKPWESKILPKTARLPQSHVEKIASDLSFQAQQNPAHRLELANDNGTIVPQPKAIPKPPSPKHGAGDTPLPPIDKFRKLAVTDPRWIAAKSFLSTSMAAPNQLQYFTKHADMIRHIVSAKEAKLQKQISTESLRKGHLGSSESFYNPFASYPLVSTHKSSSTSKPHSQTYPSQKRGPTTAKRPRVVLGSSNPRHQLQVEEDIDRVEEDDSTDKKRDHPRKHRKPIQDGATKHGSKDVQSPEDFEDISEIEERPSMAGKQLNNRAIQEYYRSLQQDTLFGRETMEEMEAAVNRREPSPVTSEDEKHWVYQVKRKQWPLHQKEDDVDWFIIGCPSMYSLDKANKTAAAEIYHERDGFSIQPQELAKSIAEPDKYGMMHHHIISIYGSIMIKVERLLRVKGSGKLPRNKDGWLPKTFYMIWKETWRVKPRPKKVKEAASRVDCAAGSRVSADKAGDDDGFDDLFEDPGDPGPEATAGALPTDISDCEFDALFEESPEVTHPKVIAEPAHPSDSSTRDSESESEASANEETDDETNSDTDSQSSPNISTCDQIHREDLGAYTILDDANRKASLFVRDIIAPEDSRRMDEILFRRDRLADLMRECDNLKAGDEAFEAEVQMGRMRVRVFVEEMRVNGPWNI